MLVLVESDSASEAGRAADALAARLASRTDLFENAQVMGGGEFFAATRCSISTCPSSRTSPTASPTCSRSSPRSRATEPAGSRAAAPGRDRRARRAPTWASTCGCARPREHGHRGDARRPRRRPTRGATALLGGALPRRGAPSRHRAARRPRSYGELLFAEPAARARSARRRAISSSIPRTASASGSRATDAQLRGARASSTARASASASPRSCSSARP